MASQFLDRAARDLTAHFPGLALAGVANITPLSPGFSGAAVWRIVTAAGDSFCLRAWPVDVEPRHVAFVHGLMAQASSLGLAFVPRLLATGRQHTVVEDGGRLWEVQQWMTGRADFQQNPTRARLQAACNALARLHGAWAMTESNPQNSCPGIVRRLAAVEEWQALLAGGWRPLEAMAPTDGLRPLAERALRVLPEQITWTARQLRACAGPWLLQPCLCDPWHDHYLFDGDTLTGLIDYGAVQIDHPAVDLARTLGSLLGDNDESWTTGLAAYRAVRPFSERDEVLTHLLDRTGVVLSVARWLVRLFHANETIADRHALERRLEVLIARIERWPGG